MIKYGSASTEHSKDYARLHDRAMLFHSIPQIKPKMPRGVIFRQTAFSNSPGVSRMMGRAAGGGAGVVLIVTVGCAAGRVTNVKPGAFTIGRAPRIL